MHVGPSYRLIVPLKLGSESWELCHFNCPQAQISFTVTPECLGTQMSHCMVSVKIIQHSLALSYQWGHSFNRLRDFSAA